ncbi:MAG: hypothetical protein HXY41_06075 [Chloroflexi bacterium]|nr:hypothetical protein [Chloroflexota bacterium]
MMRTRSAKISLALVIGVCLIVPVAALLWPVGQAVAQPRATIQARSTEAAMTVQAQFQGAAGTVEARVTGFDSMVTAAWMTSQARLTDVAATMSSFSALAAQGAANLRATGTAIVASLQAALAALPPELAELVTYLADQSSLVYDPTTQTLDATTFVSEAQANLLLDTVLLAVGYNPDAAGLETFPGYVVVTLVDASAQLPGTVELTYTLAAEEGRATATLISVTINGRDVPADQLPDDLLAALEMALAGAATQTMLNAQAMHPAYTVDAVDVSDEGFLVAYTIYLQP